MSKGPTRRFGQRGFKEMDETVKSEMIEIFKKQAKKSLFTNELKVLDLL